MMTTINQSINTLFKTHNLFNICWFPKEVCTNHAAIKVDPPLAPPPTPLKLLMIYTLINTDINY